MLLLLFNKFKVWIIGAGAILAAFLYLKGRSDGEENAERKADEAIREDVAKAKDIRDNVDSLSDDELDKRLSDWTRKG